MDPERWQRVAHLYESVLEHESAQRAAFLAEASAGDDDLRREVQSLLEHDNTPLLIDEPMLETAAAVLDDQDDQFDLKPGDLLGSYRIDRLLGRGGMGQVYRAVDARLNRTVALKVLPRGLANDSQFRARFEGEAHAVAALAHPHICTLHDIGRHEGVDFLVMEYLEGETLARRLERGQIAVGQALTFAMHIADALAAAHRGGIVHRDLKPSNIILARSGAKLVDFGLAKPVASSAADRARMMPSTMPRGVTAQGTIVGTLQHMAPEQLEGKDADARTDIFAFGTVLYEMLTGNKAFEGKSQASLIGAIMHAQPAAISASQPLTPPALDRVVKICLAKEPDNRWQSARDLLHELEAIRDQLPSVSPLASKNRALGAWVVPVLLSAIAIAVIARQVMQPDSHSAVARFAVAPPEGTSLPVPGPSSPQISPDGTRVVFHVSRGGEWVLALRSIDDLQAHVIAGTERGRFPFWSTNSRDIAFFADGKLKSINVAGGPVQVICDTCRGIGGTWNQEDVIVFLAGGTEGLYKVAASGGAPTALTSFRHAERFQYRPAFLPDGRRFLYFLEPDAIYLASLDSGESRRIAANGTGASYSAPGFLIHRQGRTLIAQRFDDNFDKPLGNPVPIAGDVVPPRLRGGEVAAGSSFSISSNGVLAYTTLPEVDLTLSWFDRTGQFLGTIGSLPFRVFGGANLSPDGTRIAMQSPVGPDPNSEIWLFDLTQRRSTQLTFVDGADRAPIWSPDGQRLVFASLRLEAPGMYVKNASGGQPEQLLLPSQTVSRDEQWPSDWSSDGIVFLSGRDRQSDDIWMLPLAGDRKAYPLVREPGQQSDARISPDGKWLAYRTEFPNGPPEVVIQSLTARGAKWRVSTGGGASPRWRRDGKEVFYLAADGRLMAISIESDAGGLRLSAPTSLFQTSHLVLGTGQRLINVSADGERFLISTPVGQPRSPSIVVVTNWPAVLRRERDVRTLTR
jgi:eukaryotic-like serine/threonine-protein kinase